MPKKPSPQVAVPTAQDEQIKSLEERLARALADYQNLEKRFARDSASIVKFANASLLEKLLDLRDHLGAAASHLGDQSLKMILTSLDKILTDEGVTTINVSNGPFDPASMECQEIVPGVKDQVVSVIRPGYRLHDRLLRTARVTVGDGSSAKKVN